VALSTSTLIRSHPQHLSSRTFSSPQTNSASIGHWLAISLSFTADNNLGGFHLWLWWIKCCCVYRCKFYPCFFHSLRANWYQSHQLTQEWGCPWVALRSLWGKKSRGSPRASLSSLPPGAGGSWELSALPFCGAEALLYVWEWTKARTPAHLIILDHDPKHMPPFL
jgi:hypothetical protein